MSIELLDPNQAKARQDEGWTYVDVRTPEEFANGHPAGAVNVPVAFASGGRMVANPDFLTQMTEKFSTDTTLLLGCKSGGRSMTAAKILEGAGFTNLVNVEGGFLGSPTQPGWQPLGLPTE